MGYAYISPRLLTFEELAIIADLARAGTHFADSRPDRSRLLFEIIEEVAAGNAEMFPQSINDTRIWLAQAGIPLPSVELLAHTPLHLLTRR